MALGALAQLHISVTDLPRAIAFYRDVLRIPFLFEVEGQPMAFFQSGDVRLYLGRPERAEFTSRVVAYFRVEDIEAEHERLVGLGVSFGDGGPHVVHRDGVNELWMTGFQDPDGNHLVLMAERTT
ncbi:VOC family protein [Tenggerimyces flavus]|uniref:VOC family protein n=1 Tax=Tenggerimyces flavus TaxID=1708749 RepID=A0ABV7YGG1_9ACTN|nr:VOC family protein [Tenggerimyces flavus]MBM7789249.1 putative enzyme related to lactoylglutathione lyase [Tenggerimyces flavus]